MLRIGFAGAGFIAAVHAEGLARLPDVRVAAVFDPQAERTNAFVARFGGQTAPSFEALLDGCDAVYVCTPNALHAEHAVAALDAGKHVFSEKPTATSPAGARLVAEAAQRSRGVYQVGYNKRFAPVYRELKDRIDAGDLVPRWADLKMNRGDLRGPPWVGDVALTGGFLYETPIHLLDLSCWLFGPMREVVCRARQTCSSQLDSFAMVLTFASGVSATLCSAAQTTWLYPFERIEVYGDHVTAVTEEMERITLQLGLDGEPRSRDMSALPIPDRWGYATADAAFVAAVRGERRVPVGIDEGVRAVELVDACYRAAETGTPLTLAT